MVLIAYALLSLEVSHALLRCLLCVKLLTLLRVFAVEKPTELADFTLARVCASSIVLTLPLRHLTVESEEGLVGIGFPVGIVFAVGWVNAEVLMFRRDCRGCRHLCRRLQEL